MVGMGDAPYRRGLACLLFGIALEIGGVVLELDALVRSVGASYATGSAAPVALMVGGLLLALYGLGVLWG